jgi:TolA-binding protein
MKFKGKHYVRKEDLKEDRFQTLVERFMTAYYRDRQKFWIGGAVAVAAIVGVILLAQSRGGGGANPQAEVAFTQAVGVFSTGDMAQSEQQFKEIVTRYGRTHVGAKSRYYLGNVYFNTGRYPEAKQEFAAFLARTKKDPVLSPAAQLGLANCDEQLGNNAAAAQAYEAAAKGWPKSPLAMDAWLAAARCYRNAGAYDKAADIYERLLKDKPTGEKGEEVKSQLAYAKALQQKFQ